jgi:exosome complex RNA-binding protein Rrp4
MTQTTAIMKNHRDAGLDITGQVTYVNHLNKEVPVTVALSNNGRIWVVRDLDGNILMTGGHGAKFTFAY